MDYDDLRTWIAAAESMGELKRVAGASWQEDIGQVAEMLIHSLGSPAVLFDDIPGYPSGHRILVNANATPSRLALTLGLRRDLSRHELMAEFLRLTEADRRIPPRVEPDGPVFENVFKGADVDLLSFPTPLWHPEDGGRYIGTGCAVVTQDLDGGWVNLGCYRVMIHDANHVGVYISPGKHGRQMRDAYFARKEPCPVAVVCGMDPLIFAASTVEVPFGVSEYEWSGAIRGEAYPVVRLPLTGLPVPATAEIVLEGFIHHDRMAPEGPFGEWTGYYGDRRAAEPVLEVEALYHRNQPIMLGVPPNKPPAYDPYLYREYLRSAIMMRELRGTGIPGIADVNCFAIGGTRLFNVVSIEQKYAGHARQVLHAAASVNSASYMGRVVAVVDSDIDVTDVDDVLWAILTRADPARSVDIISRALSGPLDPALEPGNKQYNSRLLIDATKPWEWRDKFPQSIGPDAQTKAETRKKWGHLLGSGSARRRLPGGLMGADIVRLPRESGAAALVRRKGEHMTVALEIGDPSGGSAGWEDVQLVHDALPEIDFDRVGLAAEILGRPVALPLLISGMTGGHERSLAVNRALARAAAATGAMIGVGSQRAALRDPSCADSYSVVRDEAPDNFVLANIGIGQLISQADGPALRMDDVLRAVDMVRADALAVHLNYLEEIVQPEGQTRAAGATAALRDLARELPVPVIAKETGAGLSREVALRLRDAGVAALDVGGRGGTSFAAIEASRAAASGDRVRAATGLAFADWGIPTAASVALCADVLPTIAVGGVRDGLDAARAMSLGAVAVGVGRPLLEEALRGGTAAVQDWIQSFAHQLRSAAFLAGVPSAAALGSARRIVRGQTRRWIDELGAHQ